MASTGRKHVVRAAIVVLILAALATGGAALWLRGELRGSLPEHEGEQTLAGLDAPVRVERDDLGVPVIRGTSRLDVAAESALGG